MRSGSAAAAGGVRGSSHRDGRQQQEQRHPHQGHLPVQHGREPQQHRSIGSRRGEHNPPQQTDRHPPHRHTPPDYDGPRDRERDSRDRDRPWDNRERDVGPPPQWDGGRDRGRGRSMGRLPLHDVRELDRGGHTPREGSPYDMNRDRAGLPCGRQQQQQPRSRFEGSRPPPSYDNGRDWGREGEYHREPRRTPQEPYDMQPGREQQWHEHRQEWQLHRQEQQRDWQPDSRLGLQQQQQQRGQDRGRPGRQDAAADRHPRDGAASSTPAEPGSSRREDAAARPPAAAAAAAGTPSDAAAAAAAPDRAGGLHVDWVELATAGASGRDRQQQQQQQPCSDKPSDELEKLLTQDSGRSQQQQHRRGRSSRSASPSLPPSGQAAAAAGDAAAAAAAAVSAAVAVPPKEQYLAYAERMFREGKIGKIKDYKRFDRRMGMYQTQDGRCAATVGLSMCGCCVWWVV